MKKTIRILLSAIGILFMLNTLILTFLANFNTGFIVVFLLGVLFLIYGLKFDKINSLTQTGVLKWLKYAVFSGLSVMFLTIIFLNIYSVFDNVTYNEDVLIVLGSGIKGEKVSLPLENRLRKAIEYFEKNPDCIIVVSGGQGPQEDITEALAMERYLIAKGFPKEKIIKEEKSTNTFENFKFSKEILDSHFNTTYKVAYTTNNFHIFRAGLMARRNGINAAHIHAQLSGFNMPVNYVREFFALIITFIQYNITTKM